jgi:phosphoribosylanthranilate isomerase
MTNFKLPVKVCGMRDADNIRAIASLAALQPRGVDFMGFIFYERSPRFAGVALENAETRELVRSLRLPPFGIQTVGVFVNSPTSEIMRCVQDFDFAAVQLHGDEPPEFCAALKQVLRDNNSNSTTIIKALSIATEQDVERSADYHGVVNFLLFDTKPVTSEQFGGTGERFDWRVLEAYTARADAMPFFLSGGISADSADEIKRLRHPQLHTLDINSRFETAPGVKDAAAIERFLHALGSFEEQP